MVISTCQNLFGRLLQPAVLRRPLPLAVLLAMLALAATTFADEGTGAKADDPLTQQKQVAERFRQLKKALIRMSDPATGTDARRAALVKQAVTQSNDLEIEAQFEKLAALVASKRFSAASKDQDTLHQDLRKLLDVLLSEDRIHRLESEKQRLREYIKKINQVIKQQRSLEDQSGRSADPKSLSKDQHALADRTGRIARDIEENEGSGGSPVGKPDGEQPPSGGKREPSPPTRDRNEADTPKNTDPDKQDQQSTPSAPGKPRPDGKDSKNAPGQPNQPPAPSPPQPADGSGKPSGGQSGKPGQPSQSAPGQPGDSPPNDGQQSPPGKNRLERAQNRMQQAERDLQDAKRDKAIESEQQAIHELEQAKAELEEVLRQLREEEIGRTLAMLESRLRKMLEMQVQVYEGTKRVERFAAGDADADRQREIESGRLSRTEAAIVSHADRALALLREEGSAVALPEAVSEVRDDMEQVVVRLAQTKVDKITQGIERDVIAALEEMIAAVAKAQKDLAEGKQPPPSGMDGEPGEPPLVDELAELKMIRAMQVRVNRRTQEYSRLISREQADQPDLVAALQRLGQREARIHRVTRDIVVGRNR